MNKLLMLLPMLIVLGFADYIQAHDAWVQAHSNLVRVGDAITVDLMMGNHGNHHRDFKLTGKADPASGTLDVIAPDGKAYDVRGDAIDTGYTPKEGYWTVSFRTGGPGLYLAVHTSDKVVSYAPARSIKSAKVFFVAPESLDRPGTDYPGFDRVLGHPLELLPLTNPVLPMGPGQSLRVRLLLHGKPLTGSTVSFIPRGAELQDAFDERYERRTDEHGEAEFTFTQPGLYLIAAHHEDPAAAGDGYEMTKYAATMTVVVPALCPCCGE